ncbi:peptidase [Mycobacterium kubicae]|nr:peptidase [Mycobacterium kubicae]QNI14995.1 peptidase [Mycobacterium kubicae]
MGVSRGHGLIGRGISRLLRRWRIPRVIRHVASRSSLLDVACAAACMAWFSTLTAQPPCARGLRIH